MIEETLLIIKPDGKQHKTEILHSIKSMGLEVYLSKQMLLPKEKVEVFYGHVKSKNEKIHKSLVDYMTSDEVYIAVLRGPHAIQKLRNKTGETDPEKALPGTIRHKYKHDSKTVADREERATQNTIHSSANEQDAKYEIEFWFYK